MSTDCTVCRTPIHDSFLCDGCWLQLSEDLRDLAGYQTNSDGERLIPLAVELDVTLSRQERRSKVTVMVTGTPEKPLPVNLHAGRVRDRLDGVLAGWVTHICLNRVYCQDQRASVVQNAQFLLRHEEDVRGLHNVDELFNQITEAIAQARKVIDNTSVRVYVGECGAQIEATEHEAAFVCTASLWADSQYAMTRCNFCETSWISMDRWEQYLAKVKAERVAAAGALHLGPRRMAAVLSGLDIPISESTIRKYARLGRITSTGEDQHGRKTYLTGDVMAIMEADSVNDVLTA